MFDSVVAIIGHLTRLRRPAAQLLQPGLSRGAIQRHEASLPFPLTPDLVALYGFKNGTAAKKGATLDALWFFPGYYWLSLEEAIRERRGRQRARGWRSGWFPVFSDGAGGYFVVSCDPNDPPGVVGFMNGEPEHEVEYLSLLKMLETLAACFDEGAFREDFEVDDAKHCRIAMRMNPGLDFWAREAAGAEERQRHAEAAELAKEATQLLKKLSPKQRREAKLSPRHRVALALSSPARLEEFLASDPAGLREPSAPDSRFAGNLLELAEKLVEYVLARPAGRKEALDLASVALDTAAAHGAAARVLADHRLVVYSLAGQLDECVPLSRLDGSTSYTTFALSTALAQATLLSHRELLSACLERASAHPELVENPVTLANLLVSLLTSDRYEEAAELAREHLKQDRTMTPALYANAVFAFARADVTDKTAQTLVERMAGLLGRDGGKYFRDDGRDLRGDAHAALGLWYARKKRVASVLQHFTQARKLKFPDLTLRNHPALLGLGEEPKLKAFFTDRADAALAAKQRQVEANDRDWFAVFSRGLLHHERGEIERAVVDYERTITLNPSYPDVYINMGNIHWTRDKDFAEAVRWYDKAIELADSHVLGRLNRAEAKLHLGDARGALVDARRGVEMEKKDSRAHFLVALAHLMLGEQGAAKKAAKAGMALDRMMGTIDREDWKAQLCVLAG